MEVVIGVSNKHAHLSLEDLKVLFGEDAKLTKMRDLLQPDQYACNEVVDIKSENGSLTNIRVIGPVREYTQVEISRSDAVKLKLNPPVRDSGDLVNSEAITIIGPKGTIKKDSGCIIAKRHIHITEKMKLEMGLEGVKTVSVKINSNRPGTFHDVALKVSEKASLEFHIDTDEANGMGAKSGDIATIIVD